MNYIVQWKLEKAYENNMTADELENNLANLQKQGDELFDYDEIGSIDVLKINTNIDRKLIIGAIYVPSVDIKLPILYGSNETVLRSAVGTYRANQTFGEGNFVLLGHNARNPKVLFASIRHIQKGDKIYITNKKKVYIYEQYDSVVVSPYETSYLDESEGHAIISLVSCYASDGSNRIIVRGKLVDVVDFEQSDETVQQVFEGL